MTKTGRIITATLLTIATIGLVVFAVKKGTKPKTLQTKAEDTTYTIYSKEETKTITYEGNAPCQIVFTKARAEYKGTSGTKAFFWEYYVKYYVIETINNYDYYGYKTTNKDEFETTFTTPTSEELEANNAPWQINILACTRSNYVFKDMNNNYVWTSNIINTHFFQNNETEVNNPMYQQLLVGDIYQQLLYGTLQISEFINAYNQGYQNGETDGYQTGYTAGNNTGYTTGYNAGQQNGYAEGYNDSESFNHPIALQPLMLNILTMPFTFISQAFNVTLWPNTQYEFNIANFIKGLIAIATILFIIKMFTSGFSIIGNFTDNTNREIKMRSDNRKSKLAWKSQRIVEKGAKQANKE